MLDMLDMLDLLFNISNLANNFFIQKSFFDVFMSMPILCCICWMTA